MAPQKMDFSRMMTDFRKRFLLTQERIAEIFGLKNSQVISQWETGHHEPMKLIKKIVMTLMILPKSEAEKFLMIMDRDNMVERQRNR